MEVDRDGEAEYLFRKTPSIVFPVASASIDYLREGYKYRFIEVSTLSRECNYDLLS